MSITLQSDLLQVANGLSSGCVLHGDARELLAEVPSHSIDLSFWSPPYYVGKSYERDWTFQEWSALLHSVIQAHSRIIKPGGFMAVNIGDILCFPDAGIPRFQADNVRGKKVRITREEILQVKASCPDATRYELAALLGCSEQTIQRRLQDNNVRGGKASASTKVVLTGCMVSEWAEDAGLYLV